MVPLNIEASNIKRYVKMLLQVVPRSGWTANPKRIHLHHIYLELTAVVEMPVHQYCWLSL